MMWVKWHIRVAHLFLTSFFFFLHIFISLKSCRLLLSNSAFPTETHTVMQRENNRTDTIWNVRLLTHYLSSLFKMYTERRSRGRGRREHPYLRMPWSQSATKLRRMTLISNPSLPFWLNQCIVNKDPWVVFCIYRRIDFSWDFQKGLFLITRNQPRVRS